MRKTNLSLLSWSVILLFPFLLRGLGDKVINYKVRDKDITAKNKLKITKFVITKFKITLLKITNFKMTKIEIVKLKNIWNDSKGKTICHLEISSKKISYFCHPYFELNNFELFSPSRLVTGPRRSRSKFEFLWREKELLVLLLQQLFYVFNVVGVVVVGLVVTKWIGMTFQWHIFRTL